VTVTHHMPGPTDPNADPAYHAQITALTAAYQRTVDTIMTNRYGPDWASRGDLPDEAYTTETVFKQWLDDLLDHIDTAATPAARVAAS
jgi:hypothetical protein